MSKNDMETDLKPEALGVLKDALAEARVTVRAYDTKAQIVGVGYAFALGIVGGTSDWFPKPVEADYIRILVFWGIVMAPLMLFGYVLYPTRKTAPKVEGDAAKTLERVLYLDPAQHGTVEAVKLAVGRCEPSDEYAYELLKTSKLRELKRVRFIRALITAAAAFVALFAAHLLGTIR